MEMGGIESKIMMPHGHCYLWREELLWTHVLSDGLIAAAYASIPAALIYLVWKRKDLEFNWMFVLFGVFILACGTTHVLAIISVWEPIYYVSAGVKVLTAAASVGTAVALWPLIPKIMLIPSPSQLQAVNDDLADEVEQHRSARVRLLEQSKELKNQAAQLLASNQELSEANEMVRAYFDAAANEIQGPLKVADADLDRVRSAIESGLVEDGKDILGSIRQRMRGVQRSVERVLAKASLSVWEPEMEECIVGTVAQEVQNEFGFSETEMEIVGSLPVVHADRIGLKLVLTNAMEAILAQGDGKKKVNQLCLSSKPVGFAKEINGPAWEILMTAGPAAENGDEEPPSEFKDPEQTNLICESVMNKQGGAFSFMSESSRLTGARILLSASSKESMEA